MPLYPDSSFLFSLLSKDAQTPAATKYMARSRESLAFTPLHRFEVRNALRSAAERGVITQKECNAAFRLIEQDLEERFFIHTPIKWVETFRRADDLSEKFAARQGQRAIDLLHVALAMECAATIFLSFDQRQRKLADAAGLQVKP